MAKNCRKIAENCGKIAVLSPNPPKPPGATPLHSGHTGTNTHTRGTSKSNWENCGKIAQLRKTAKNCENCGPLPCVGRATPIDARVTASPGFAAVPSTAGERPCAKPSPSRTRYLRSRGAITKRALAMDTLTLIKTEYWGRAGGGGIISYDW